MKLCILALLTLFRKCQLPSCFWFYCIMSHWPEILSQNFRPQIFCNCILVTGQKLRTYWSYWISLKASQVAFSKLPLKHLYLLKYNIVILIYGKMYILQQITILEWPHSLEIINLILSKSLTYGVHLWITLADDISLSFESVTQINKRDVRYREEF